MLTYSVQNSENTRNILKRKYIMPDTITQSQVWNGRYGRENSVLASSGSYNRILHIRWLKQDTLFLKVVETGKSKIRMPSRFGV